ncbi:MAG: hypothetical protein J1E07_02985 [Treponema sp.]|nr:hypothetical protein [Treponema sp.]
MRKFAIAMLILIPLSAVVFFIGWTQFKVKAENVGVVISKTSGVSEVPVENGVFSWHWQFLVPGNATLRTFSIKPLNVTESVAGELSAGGAYGSYSFTFAVSLTVSPENLVRLVKLNRVTDSDDLRSYMEQAAKTVSQLAADYYLKKASENQDFRPESVRRDDLLRVIRMYEDFPELELTVFALTSSKLPDFELYRRYRTHLFYEQESAENEES